MTPRTRPALAALALAIGSLLAPGVHAGSFVYEGKLEDGAAAANGRYDFEILPYTDAALGGPVASPIRFEGVEVKDGRFRLDFELPAEEAGQLWLALAVRSHGSGAAYAAFPGRTKAVAAGPIGLCWSSTGDSNTDPAVNFLGTTDERSFVIRTWNAPSLRVEPSTITFATRPITSNVVAGSHANSVTSGVRGATIAGGGMPDGETDPDFSSEEPNRVTDHYGTVSGGFANRAGNDGGTLVDSAFAAVGGGAYNAANGRGSTVGGGNSNTANGSSATIAGGSSNVATGSSGAIGGGASNSASGQGSTVGGGVRNVASDTYAVVGGGQDNVASGHISTVGGGLYNTASGELSTVGGGMRNCAGALYSWSGGYRAKVRPGSNSGAAGEGCLSVPTVGTAGDQGTFVWADSQIANFISTGPNQFLARADGGFGLNTNTIPNGIEAVLQGRSGPNGNVDLYLKPAAHGRGINLAMLPGTGAAAFYVSQYDGSSFVDRILLTSSGDFWVTEQAYKPGGGSWAALSDARLKTGVRPLSGALDRLLALRGVEFEFRADVTPKMMYLPGRQIGFVAQEVEAVIPEWVAEGEDGYKTVGPRGFEALAVEAFRELRAESATIDRAQDERIAALQAQLTAQARSAESERTKLLREIAELRALVSSMAGANRRAESER